MKTAVKRTFLCAVLLLILAAAAPFLCLLPFFAPGDTGDSPSSTALPDASAQEQEDTTPDTPRAEPQAILVWDDAAGEAISVPALEYLLGEIGRAHV